MPRRTFFSFHFDLDSWRASQVRSMGMLEGNEPVSPNEWEEVRRGKDAAIERWIAAQMSGRVCAVVLVGSETANRPWVRYEIKKAWMDGLGVVGVRIHGLKDRNEKTALPGANPFAAWRIGEVPMDQIVTLYNPPGADSKGVYSSISNNLATLVENAIKTRARY